MDKMLEALNKASNILKDMSESCKQLDSISEENETLVNMAININKNNFKEINNIKNIIKE